MPTAWTPALDVFEANLDRIDAAIADGAWDQLALAADLPAFDVEPTATEHARFEDLRERAGALMTRVQRQMNAVKAEQLAGDTKIAAARTYGRGF